MTANEITPERAGAGAPLHLRFGMLELAERHLAALEQNAAGVGQADAVAVPLEERVDPRL